jgi:hypothetical protein
MQFVVATECGQVCSFASLISGGIVSFVEPLWSTGDEKLLSARVSFVETSLFFKLSMPMFVTEN